LKREPDFLVIGASLGKPSTSTFRAIAFAAVAVLLVWHVATRSLVAYLAKAAPDTALGLRSTDPTALLNLAERSLAPKETAAGPASQPDQAAANRATASEQTDEQASDRLRLWSELAFKATDKDIKSSAANRTSGSTEPPRPSILGRDTIEQSSRWAKLALANDPINARALGILGQLAVAAGEEADVAKFLHAAARRSIRESLAVYWLMWKSYEDRDYATAIYCADALLRTRSQAAAQVMPILIHMAENSSASGELTKTLLNNPPWRSNFLSSLGQKAKDPRVTLELLLALRETSTPPKAEDVRNYVNALIGRKNYELAYYAWLQFLPPEQLGSSGFLFNGSFDVTPSGLPFDWVMGEGSGVTMDIVNRPDQPDRRALLIEFGHGRVDFNGVQQLTMLAPGTYEFKGRYRGELVGKRGLVWRITCIDAPGAPLGESPMVVGASPKWKDIDFSFAVPETDCRAQQVRLELDARMASELLVSGAIWYDELRIARVDKLERP